jgi:hypothetical protein
MMSALEAAAELEADFDLLEGPEEAAAITTYDKLQMAKKMFVSLGMIPTCADVLGLVRQLYDRLDWEITAAEPAEPAAPPVEGIVIPFPPSAG